MQRKRNPRRYPNIDQFLLAVVDVHVMWEVQPISHKFPHQDGSLRSLPELKLLDIQGEGTGLPWFDVPTKYNRDMEIISNVKKRNEKGFLTEKHSMNWIPIHVDIEG